MAEARIKDCHHCGGKMSSEDYPGRVDDDHASHPEKACLERLESYAGLYELALIFICRSDDISDIWKIAKKALTSVQIARTKDEPLDGKNEDEKDTEPGG